MDTADAAGFGAADDDGASGARREALSAARVLAARRAEEEGCIGALRDAIKSADAGAIEHPRLHYNLKRCACTLFVS